MVTNNFVTAEQLHKSRDKTTVRLLAPPEEPDPQRPKTTATCVTNEHKEREVEKQGIQCV